MQTFENPLTRRRPKMAKKHHEWFVWAKDGQTNEAVAKHNSEGDNRFEEEAFKGILCTDGHRRNLWRCTEAQAYFLYKSMGGGSIAVFNRIGRGKPRNVTFLFRKKRKLPANPRGKI